METINDVVYHAPKKSFKDFEMKGLVEYHDLGNTLLLADVADNFQNLCFKIHDLYFKTQIDHARFFFYCLRLSFQAALKNSKLKLDLLTDNGMLLSLFRMGGSGAQKNVFNPFSTLV